MKYNKNKLLEIELTKKLVMIFSKERASDFNSWRRVGFAIRAVDESLFDLFVKFSKKDMRKYKENKVSCEKIWKVADEYKQFYTIGSIRHWARTDNKDEYYKIITEMYSEIFDNPCKHTDIATIVYELYKDRFVCTDIAKKKWYEFQEDRWVFVESAWTLEVLLSDEIRDTLFEYFSNRKEKKKYDDEGKVIKNTQSDIDYKVKQNQRILTSIMNLGDVNFRMNIVRACANKFYDPKFLERLDCNIYLVGFDNGVFDLKEGCFRNGLPSDYVSKSVGYDWVDYSEDDAVFKKIDKYFSEVQTENDMKEYILTFIASILRGEPDQKVHIWTGGGGNGKSATVDLIKNMLGDYFGVVPVTLITRKRGGSSTATPELADKNGKRLLVIQEPEHNDVVYVGQMKEYTGKDTILARPLYCDPFYYTPQYKMVLTCNKLPTIPSTDDGTWRRLRVTPWESKFVDDNPDPENRIFLKDEELQEEFPTWASPLMWLVATKYYKTYEKGIDGKKYKIVEPEKVKFYTNEYKKKSDIYMDFLDTNVKKTDCKDDKEDIGFVYENFKSWYVQSYSDKPPNRNEFKEYMKNKGYKLTKTDIIGITIVYDSML